MGVASLKEISVMVVVRMSDSELLLLSGSGFSRISVGRGVGDDGEDRA